MDSKKENEKKTILLYKATGNGEEFQMRIALNFKCKIVKETKLYRLDGRVFLSLFSCLYYSDIMSPWGIILWLQCLVLVCGNLVVLVEIN